MKKLLFFGSLTFLFSKVLLGQNLAINLDGPNTGVNSLSSNASSSRNAANQVNSYRILTNADNSYGYEILIKNKILIKQLTIPGRPGTTGFKRKEDAEKVACLVIKKLDKGIMPPTVDEKELIKLNIKL